MDLETIARQVMDRIFIELEASARHAHVTEAQAQVLFGHKLTPKRELSQPGQFLANERVTVIGPKGEITNVAVLGPERKDGQVELSMTDARTLGIDAPVRLSGDIANTPGIKLQGERGTVVLNQGAIVAKRHIHITPEDAQAFGVSDKEIVKVKVDSDGRSLIFDDVVVRVSASYATAMHIDTDEANACGGATVGEIVK